jgi:hypothetical protein
MKKYLDGYNIVMVLLEKRWLSGHLKKLGVIFNEESIGNSPFSVDDYEFMYVHGFSNIL